MFNKKYYWRDLLLRAVNVLRNIEIDRAKHDLKTVNHLNKKNTQKITRQDLLEAVKILEKNNVKPEEKEDLWKAI